MPLRRPTLPELISRTDAELAQRLGFGALLRRGVAAALSRVMAGLAHGWYGALDWASRQAFVDTAAAEFLDDHARRWGLKRKPAAYAVGTVTLTGAEGSVVPPATLLQRADGVQYLTTAEGTIDATGSVTIAIEAVVAAGSGNASEGTTISLVSPVSGVQIQGSLGSGGATGGVDSEGDEDLRARIQLRIQEPPMGGTEADFVQWALEVPGVTRAWAIGNYFRYGTVGVWFVVDDDPAGLIPSPAKVAEVQAAIDLVRPVTAQTTVLAPVATAVDFTIHVEPDTPGVRALVEAALEDLVRRKAEPGGTILESTIREAISTVPGETDHTLVAPAGDVVHAAGQLPVPGVITWA